MMTSGYLLLCTFALLTAAACGTDAGYYTLGLDAASDVAADAADAASSVDTPGVAADAESDLVSDTGSDTATDASTDTGTTEDGGTTNDGGTTEDGGICDNPCTSNRDCAALGTNFTCEEGCCVEGGGTDPLVACAAPGQACSDPSQTSYEYFCDTVLGECVTRCVFDDRFEDDFGGCPLNTFCGAQLTGVEDGDLDGVCIPGDCDTSIFDEAACEGLGTCTPLANGASFCFDAGTALEGEACNTDTSDIPPAGDICAAGLLCFDNVCEVPCNLRNVDADCSGGESCLQVRDITPRNQPGVCGTACEPFGTCGEGSICEPQTGNLGITEWVCIPAGPNVAAAGEDCSAVGTRCEEGTLCINQGSTEAPDLVCEEVCATGDPTTGLYGACSSTLADDFVCTPSTLDGLGFCNESCEPFPRDGDYGCEDETNSCLPFVAFDDRIVEPQGSCVETAPEATVERGGSCSPESFFVFNAECADYAVCSPTDETETEGICTPLCEPFSTGQCDDIGMTCRGDLPLTGVLEYSLCTAEFQAGEVGDRCDNGDDAEFFCEGDGAMCFTFEGGATSGTCFAACRGGDEYDDCAQYGQVCVTGGLNPEVVPTYIGLCENP